MNPPSRVLQKITARQTVLTAKACYSDPELVELMASAGVDAIWICLEHKQTTPDTLYGMIQACRLGNADALIRVKPSNHTDILHLLEFGARGLMIPRVRHPAEVREIVDWMKFPPAGRRGIDGIHAEADFGRKPMREYLEGANRENYLVIQIEEPEVIPHIEEIAAMPGVDVLFVGPGDLGLGLGKFGQLDDPEISGVIDRVSSACQAHGKTAAIPCGPDEVAKYRDRGYSFFNIFSDFRGITNGLKQALTVARGK